MKLISFMLKRSTFH